MSVIADSDAVYDEERLLAQHQAALTVIQGILDDPRVANFRWLDLACGKGQIIVHLETNLSASARGKIEYFGYDIQVAFAKYAERKAGELGLRSTSIVIGEISAFSNQFPDELGFDFITLTNTIHEIDPNKLASVLFDCVTRLSDHGSLFIYDMEILPVRELGAVLWKRLEIGEIIKTFLQALGMQLYLPFPGKWLHKTCNGWNLRLQRDLFDIDLNTVRDRRDEIISVTEGRIREILVRKLEECRASLANYTKFGTETDAEEAHKLDLLHDYWALSLATGGAQ